MQLSDNASTPLDAETLGLFFIDNNLVASHAFLLQLNNVVFPLSGNITIKDDRTSCAENTLDIVGPCVRTVPFRLNMAQFSQSCPQDLVLFSQTPALVVTWKPPQVRLRSGQVISLTSPTPSGSVFPLGITVVNYSLPIDSSQNPSTRINCTFKVWRVSPSLE
jgi:hypothetical protein